MFLFTIIVTGLIMVEAVVIRLVMALPMIAGNILDVRVFNPDRDWLYRKLAFCIIAIPAIQDFPLFD